MNKKRFFSSGSELFLFKEQALMVVAAVVSLLLQIISFFTTLDGAKAYFAATFAYAPLLFALAVQSVVYFLENSVRRRFSFGKGIALLMAICCSSYFSFVGIYNNINPPSQYLERTYSGYVKTLTAQQEQLLSAGDEAYTSAVDEGVNYIISTHTTLTSEKATLEKLSEEINSADSSISSDMAKPYSWQYEDYEDYAAAYAAYIASISQGSTAEQQAKLEAILNKYGMTDTSEIAARTGELAAQLSLIEGTVSAYEGEEFHARAEMLRSLAAAGDENAASKISALYKSISGNALDIPEYISDTSVTISLPSYAEIAGNDAAAVVRERLSSTVAAACDTLSAAGCEVNADDLTFENIYTLPLVAVTSGAFGADAVISLLLAVLVDVLSLLFAMIFVKQKSVLAAKSTDQAITGNDSLFEQNIITVLRLGMCGEGRAFSEQPTFDEITDRLGEFLSRFSAVDFASDKGYTLSAERSGLTGYEPLVAFLCQFGLAKVLSTEDAALFGVAADGDTVLLKTKFMLWVSEKSVFDIQPSHEKSRAERKSRKKSRETDDIVGEPYSYTRKAVTE